MSGGVTVSVTLSLGGIHSERLTIDAEALRDYTPRSEFGLLVMSAIGDIVAQYKTDSENDAKAAARRVQLEAIASKALAEAKAQSQAADTLAGDLADQANRDDITFRRPTF